MAGGDQIRGGVSPELLGFLVRVTVWRTGDTRRKPSLGRIEQRQQQGAGWPKLAGAELAAAPEFRRRGKEGYGARQGEGVRALGS